MNSLKRLNMMNKLNAIQTTDSSNLVKKVDYKQILLKLIRKCLIIIITMSI